eukprot:evm.model.scf_4244.2 EVM.evm.TU.scf_4244.2   scf_4244:3716-6931(+)
MVEDSQIVSRLRELLAEADQTETSERMLREKLEAEFGVDLSDRRSLVHDEVARWLDERGAEGAEDDEAGLEEEVEENDEEHTGGWVDPDVAPLSCRARAGSKRKPEGQKQAAEAKKTRGAAKKPQKAKDDKEKKPGKRGGGGFAKPLKVSTELADFLGSTEISRPELTKFMWAYFKDNGLQNPSNKQEIISDAKLQALMKVDRFRGFGFMKHLKPHILEN